MRFNRSVASHKKVAPFSIETIKLSGTVLIGTSSFQLKDDVLKYRIFLNCDYLHYDISPFISTLNYEYEG